MRPPAREGPGTRSPGTPQIALAGNRARAYSEADQRLAALETLWAHALDRPGERIYGPDELGEHTLIMLGQARRFLEVAA